MGRPALLKRYILIKNTAEWDSSDNLQTLVKICGMIIVCLWKKVCKEEKYRESFFTKWKKSFYVILIVSRYRPLSLILSCALGVSEDAKHGSNIIQVFVSVTKALLNMSALNKLQLYMIANLVKINYVESLRFDFEDKTPDISWVLFDISSPLLHSSLLINIHLSIYYFELLYIL